MHQRNNTVTSFVKEAMSTVSKIHNQMQELHRLISWCPTFDFQTPKRSANSSVTFWNMTLTIQVGAQKWSQYHQSRSIILQYRMVFGMVPKSPQNHPGIIRRERPLWEAGNVGLRGGNGILGTSEESIQQVREILGWFYPYYLSCFQQISASSYDHTSHFAQLSHFVSLQASPLQSLNEGEEQNRLEFAETCFTQPEGYSDL